MRRLFALFFLLLGAYLAWSSARSGQPVQAFALALAGCYLSLAVVVGINASLNSLTFNLSASAIGLLGIAAVFIYSNSFNYTLQGSYFDAIYDIGTLELRCKPMTKELRNLQDLGMRACATQRSGDQFDAVVALSKGLYFGPALTVLDSSATASQGSPPNYCARTVQEIVRQCSHAFTSVSKEGRAALREAAK